MRPWKIFSASLLSMSICGASAEAGSLCTTPDEMAALRTAAVQQELMVAGLTCQASDAYNRFVLAYRPELQKSDADLKAYFLRREGARGEAAYDTFKTKLANLASFSDVTNSASYCANTRAAFSLALASHQGLASFVADQRLMIALPAQQLCTTDPAAPIMAAAAPAPVKLATATPVAVSGVPQHSLPAAPYGVGPATPRSRVMPAAPTTYPPPQNYDDQDNDQDFDDEDNDGPDVAPIPPAYQHPQRPPTIEAQRMPYGEQGWPPAWPPRPYPRRATAAPYPYPYYCYGR
jgi:hypothetical protein